MKVAYVAGPYRAKDERERVANIKKAEFAAVRLWKAGFAVICPHLNGTMFSHKSIHHFIAATDTEGVKMILEGDKEIMSRCDFVVLFTRNWGHSEGTCGEVEHCRETNKRLYPSVEEAIDAEAV